VYQDRFSIVEGFYGESYSFDQRTRLCEALSGVGLKSYLYAPKEDAWLRKNWAQPYPDSEFSALRTFSDSCHQMGVQFGIGLSPFELYLDFDAQKTALVNKLRQLEKLNIDFLGLLFDDMRGDVPHLARLQVEIAHFVREVIPDTRIILCPTYYSYDPILDKVFGERPSNYLAELGEQLHADIDIFWTGDRVVSQSYSPEGMKAIAAKLKRNVVLWDNYPVNDGERMSRFLHLKPVNPLCDQAKRSVKDRFANPMNQPMLSLLPLASFANQTDNAAASFYSPEFAEVVIEYMPQLAEQGLDAMTDADKQLILGRCQQCNDEAARELERWLNEGYRFDPSCLTD